jgi:nitrate reductase gamma subunit
MPPRVLPFSVRWWVASLSSKYLRGILLTTCVRHACVVGRLHGHGLHMCHSNWAATEKTEAALKKRPFEKGWMETRVDVIDSYC